MSSIRTYNSLPIVPYVGEVSAEQSDLYEDEDLKSAMQSVMDSFTAYIRSLEEGRYLRTYKALHLGTKETLESRMIRAAIPISRTHTESETAQRLLNYNRVINHLSALSDEQVSNLVALSTPLSSGIGGDVLSIEVEGVPVIIKKIRLTTIEQQNPRSTLNLFELPLYYQYGVGSMGFGVWREIAAHEITTKWVLQGECQNFPLMYHSRTLERMTPSITQTTERLQERDRYVTYWNGSAKVAMRAQEVDQARADVVVFMEHFPETLYRWLHVQGSRGALTEEAMTKVERELTLVTSFMNSKGFLHFDAHFGNILARDNHIYFADFGLAMSQQFNLIPEEKDFLDTHNDYDRYYVVAELAKNAITATVQEESEVLLDRYLSNEKIVTPLPPVVESVVERYRPIAVLMEKFFQGLRKESKSTTLYPKIALEQEWSKLQNTTY